MKDWKDWCRCKLRSAVILILLNSFGGSSTRDPSAIKTSNSGLGQLVFADISCSATWTAPLYLLNFPLTGYNSKW